MIEGEMDDFPLIEIKKTKIQRRYMSGPSSQRGIQARPSCLPQRISVLKEGMLIIKKKKKTKENLFVPLEQMLCFPSALGSLHATSYSIRCGRSPGLSSTHRSLSLAPGGYFPPLGTGHSAAP